MGQVVQRVCVIGYGGHGYVACDILASSGCTLLAYCDREEKRNNPFNLEYWGDEMGLEQHRIHSSFFFPSVGNNSIRKSLMDSIKFRNGRFINAIHPSAVISSLVDIGSGTMVCAGVVINPMVRIGDGVICNTSCSIDHGVTINNFVHVCPGAVICGDVTIGNGSFIGAGAVIRQGIQIGSGVIIGAGSVVIRDVPDSVEVAGVPAIPLLK